MPGVGLTALFTPSNAHMPDIIVFFGAQFLCNWILLFATVMLFEKFFKGNRDQE